MSRINNNLSAIYTKSYAIKSNKYVGKYNFTYKEPRIGLVISEKLSDEVTESYIVVGVKNNIYNHIVGAMLSKIISYDIENLIAKFDATDLKIIVQTFDKNGSWKWLGDTESCNNFEFGKL